MNGKLSLLSAAVIMALAGTQADAKQNNVKPSLAGPGGHAGRPHVHRPQGGDTTLYSQTSSSYINGIVSQNFSSFYATFDNAGADDFVVTDATGWTVDEVDVDGLYFNGSGPADSFDVTIYPDDGGVPGATASCALTGLTYTAGAPGASGYTSFAIPLTGGCTLPQGTYWLSVAANLNFSAGGEFGWGSYNASPAIGAPAMWQNPDDGFATGCSTWDLASTCVGGQSTQGFSVIGHVSGGGGPGIALTVGLALANGDPNECGTATTLSVTVGDQVNYCYTVTNNSTTTLNYHTLIDDVPETIFSNVNVVLAPGANYQYNRIVTATASDTITSTWTAADELPGYTPSAGTTAFIPIDATGTALSFPGTVDDGTVPVTMPFSFNFYGASSNQLVVGNNGAILFGTSSGAVPFGNSSLPTAAFATPVVMPFWDDLYNGGEIYTSTVGTAPDRQFIVEYFQKNHYSSGNSNPGGVTFEVVFTETANTIDFIYDTVEFGTDGTEDGGASATVGLQFNTTTANQYSFDTASLTDGQDILWTASSPTTYSASATVSLDVGAPVLTLDPTSLTATADAGATTTQTLTIGNTGDRDLVWNLTEAGATAHFVAVPGTPRYTIPAPNAAERSKTMTKVHPSAKNGVSKPHQPGVKSVLGTSVPAFTFLNGSGGPNSYNAFDVLDPANFQEIDAGTTDLYKTGTFVNADFSKEYIAAISGNIATIDTATGTITEFPNTPPPSGELWVGIKWDATTSTLFGAACDSSGAGCDLLVIDPATGASQELFPLNIDASSGVFLLDIAINAQGAMYAINFYDGVLYAIDKTTGDSQSIGSTGVAPAYVQTMDFDQASGILYWASFNQSLEAEMYAVSLTDATLTDIGALPTETFGMAIAVAGGPCATPTDVPWLSESPTSGTTPGGSSTPVTVTFDATSLTNGTYNANICVNTNDNSDGHRQVAVPVTFTVGGNDTIFKDGFDGTP